MKNVPMEQRTQHALTCRSQPEEHGDLFHFSSLIYLNDDYKGGELFFMENNKERNIN